MPIYAYRCTNCGHAQDVLQKMSDPVLTVCPVCGQATYAKQLTAAGFQLKGSGWYVTDFRDGKKTEAAAGKPTEGGNADGAAAPAPDASKTDGKADSKAADNKPSSDKPADSKPAAAPAPAPVAASKPPSSGSSGSSGS